MFTVYALILIAQPEETARYLDLPDIRHGVKAHFFVLCKGDEGLAYANKF